MFCHFALFWDLRFWFMMDCILGGLMMGVYGGDLIHYL